jgi:hypothetical protein
VLGWLSNCDDESPAVNGDDVPCRPWAMVCAPSVRITLLLARASWTASSRDRSQISRASELASVNGGRLCSTSARLIISTSGYSIAVATPL